jgi:hypothetical protein
MVELAVTAEHAGWDGFFLWDHIHLGDWAGPVLDPWVCLTAAAAATDRITIGTLVTPLPRRRPTKLARETVTLDHLSGGRLILGVGIGWPPDVDFGDLGDSADNRVRGAQLDEGLTVLTGLWSGEPVTYSGEHNKVAGARFSPTPLQQPRIPIWVAGGWPNRKPFRRAAAWDGVDPLVFDSDVPGGFRPPTPAELKEIVAYTLEHRDGEGPFEVAAGDSLVGVADPAGKVAEYVDAGLTWWIEGIGWPVESFEYWRDVIAAGPPRL